MLCSLFLVCEYHPLAGSLLRLLGFFLLEFPGGVPVSRLRRAAGAKRLCWGASVLGFIWPHFSLALRAACLQGNAMPPLYVFWVSLILIWVQAAGPWDAQQ